MRKLIEPRRSTRRTRLIRRVGSALFVVSIAACATSACATSGGSSDLSKPLPAGVPPGTSLKISATDMQVALTSSGQIGRLPFTVSDWPNVSAGPDVIQAFKGGAVELASNAGIPSIQAHAQGLDTRIVAVLWRSTPNYGLATAPGSAVHTLQDLRGKKIAFSPGQAQGGVVLRSLQQAGLGTKDVTLVRLNSPQFLTALQGKQVDVAPLAEPSLTKYLAQYRSAGATTVQSDAVDALSVLWAPTSVLGDDEKLAAVTQFVKFWARAKVWEWENQDRWIADYYVRNQGVSESDGRRIMATTERPYFPESWDGSIDWEQKTIDLITGSGAFGKSFDAHQLFDRRFEKIAAQAVAPQYRTEAQG
ncbi:ABC transporter substrate-binding protein [Nocardia jiangxiensis]|uniref:ABC transporter substrate-binding protein n=1 Tax=Nocardia jiangxiensis TaxID=282685 RepID=UPI00068760C1|nr:ABC transporter substrate-binding protein [Nocardia jiangxiensis]